jgi:hypothetical protein
VANETLAKVVVGAAKTPKTQETSTNKFDFFSPPLASETSEKKKSTPSVMIPLGERNCDQNVILPSSYLSLK